MIKSCILLLFITFLFLCSLNVINAHGHSHGGHGHSHGGHGHSHGGHGHSHDEVHSHSHSHSHGQDSHDEKFYQGASKYSRAANEPAQTHHSGKQNSVNHDKVNVRIWAEALSSVALISLAPLLIVFVLPLNSPPGPRRHNILQLLLSFAAGGLLGDAFLHLIPHAVMDAEPDEHLKIGLYVLSGITVFLLVEKTMRMLSGSGHGHSHEASESPRESATKDGHIVKKDANKMAASDDTTTRSRRKRKSESGSISDEKPTSHSQAKSETKSENEQIEKKGESEVGIDRNLIVAGYLNLAADFLHNMTDGLALGAGFVAGRSIGLVTTLAVLVHEVPHEVGDLAILLRAGVSLSRAVCLQLVTALGALLGCVFALWTSGNAELGHWVLPFTGGGFIYIATVSILPELLSAHTSLWQGFVQLLALLLGIGLMLLIAVYE